MRRGKARVAILLVVFAVYGGSAAGWAASSAANAAMVMTASLPDPGLEGWLKYLAALVPFALGVWHISSAAAAITASLSALRRDINGEGGIYSRLRRLEAKQE